MIYFTADCHFNHRKIIELSNRPFDNIDEMNSTLIRNWNNIIKKEDEVYVLGDFCWNSGWHKDKVLIDSLNGRKTLIIGNHDRVSTHVKTGSWFEIVSYKEIFIDNKRVCLFHYPMIEWNGAYVGSIHLHGHTHGSLNLREYQTKHDNKNSYDVGMDLNNFAPISWDKVRERIII